MNESILVTAIIAVYLLLIWNYERRLERLEVVLLQVTEPFDSFEDHLATTPGLVTSDTDNVLPFHQQPIEHWN